MVEIEPQEIADGVAVLGPVQAVDGRRPGVGTVGGRAVEGGFQPGNQIGGGGLVRAGSAGRWHLAGPELLEHPLEHRRVLRDARRIDVLQRDARRQRAVVVAGEAMAADGGLKEIAAGGADLVAWLRGGCRGRDED